VADEFSLRTYYIISVRVCARAGVRLGNKKVRLGNKKTPPDIGEGSQERLVLYLGTDKK